MARRHPQTKTRCRTGGARCPSSMGEAKSKRRSTRWVTPRPGRGRRERRAARSERHVGGHPVAASFARMVTVSAGTLHSGLDNAARSCLVRGVTTKKQVHAIGSRCVRYARRWWRSRVSRPPHRGTALRHVSPLRVCEQGSRAKESGAASLEVVESRRRANSVEAES